MKFKQILQSLIKLFKRNQPRSSKTAVPRFQPRLPIYQQARSNKLASLRDHHRAEVRLRHSRAIAKADGGRNRPLFTTLMQEKF